MRQRTVKEFVEFQNILAPCRGARFPVSGANSASVAEHRTLSVTSAWTPATADTERAEKVMDKAEREVDCRRKRFQLLERWPVAKRAIFELQVDLRR